MTMSPDAPLDSLRSLYQEIILEHYRRPRNRGEPAGPHVRVERVNPTCGDEITLYLRMEEGVLAEVRFDGQGCSISQATASMMSEVVRGRTPAEARALGERFAEMLRGIPDAAGDRTLRDLRALAGVSRFPARARCAMLAWTALDAALLLCEADHTTRRGAGESTPAD